MPPSPPDRAADARPGPKVFWRMLVGGTAALWLCLFALPPLLRRLGAAPDTANALSVVALFAILFALVWPAARAAVRG